MRTAILVVVMLLAPKPTFCADTLFRASMVAAIAAHGADLASTEHCLGSGRCRELNPWLARFENPATFGAAKMGVAGLSLWATAKLHEKNRWLAIGVNVASAIGFSYIAIHNTRVGQ